MLPPTQSLLEGEITITYKHQQIFHLHMTPAFIKIKIAANPR